MARSRLTAGFVLLLLTASACGVGNDDEEAPDEAAEGNGELVYADQFPPVADWALETDDSATLSRAGCLESLVKYESDGSLSERLATSWEQVEPTAWEFELREGVQFQDGTALNAEAVTGALTHLLEAPTPARSFNSNVVASVEAVDESTVRITTKQPDVLLPYRVSSTNTGILAPAAYAGERMEIKETCTGPFTVVDEARGQSLSLERNENYWGGTPGLARAEVKYVIDGQARATQLLTGEADIVASVPIASLANLEGEDNLTVTTSPLPRTTAMMLNNSRPPFNDPLVRQAVQSAIDVEAISEGVYEGVAAPAVGPFRPELPYAPEGASPVSQDVDEAKRLFDEAGVDPSTLSFELIAANSRPEHADVAAVIQDQLSQLGIQIEIKSGDYASFEPALLAGEYDAMLLSRNSLFDVGDPAGYLAADYSCDGGFNIAHYCDEETDAQIATALQEEDAEARYKIYANLAEKLQSEAVNVFLVHESAVRGTSARVENYEPHILEFYVLTHELRAS